MWLFVLELINATTFSFTAQHKSQRRKFLSVPTKKELERKFFRQTNKQRKAKATQKIYI